MATAVPTLPPEPLAPKHRFGAFLSYAQAPDDRLARKLESAMRGIGRRWYALRSMRVFRDKSTLPVVPDLPASLERALSESRALVLLACPESASSYWVQQELQWWLKHRSTASLYILVTGGEISWSRERSDFDWSRTTALPPFLAGHFTGQPVYVDLRWARDARTLSPRDARFRSAVLSVAAPILGRDKDELDGDDVRQHRRLRQAGYTAGLLILAFAITAAWQAYVAREERDIATARQLAAQAQANLTQAPAQIETSVLLAVESARRLRSLESDQALRNSLALLPRKVATLEGSADGHRLTYDDVFAFSGDGRYLLVKSGVGYQRQKPAARLFDLSATPPRHWDLPDGGRLNEAQLTPDGKSIEVPGEHGLDVFDTATHERKPPGSTPAAATEQPDGELVHSPDGGSFLRVKEGHLSGWKKGAKRPLFSLKLPEPASQVTFIQERLACVVMDQRLWLIDAASGTVRRKIALPEVGSMVSLSPDGRLAAVMPMYPGSSVIVIELASGRTLGMIHHEASVTTLEFDAGSTFLITADSIDDSVVSRVFIHRVEEGTFDQVASIPMRGTAEVSVSPGGEFVATRDVPGPLRIWEVASGTEWARIDADSGEFIPGTRRIAVRNGQEIGIWDFARPEKLSPDGLGILSTAAYCEIARELAQPVDTRPRVRPCSTYSCDGSRLALVVQPGEDSLQAPMGFQAEEELQVTLAASPGAPEESTHIFDARTGRDLLRLPMSGGRPREMGMAPPGAGFSSTGRYVAAVRAESLWLWDAASGRLLSQTDIEKPIREVFFTRADDAVAILGSSYPQGDHEESESIVVRELTSAGLGAVRLQRTNLLSAGLCSTGGRAWVSGASEATLLDALTGKSVASMQAVAKPLFSPDCTLLAAPTDQGVRVWSAVNGSELIRLGATDTYQLVFTPDGSHLITAAEPASVSVARIWELSTGREVGQISNQQEPSRAGIWAMFFEPSEPSRLHLVLGHTFFNDTQPASALWRTSDLADAACRRLTRNLTPEEWQRHLGSQRYRKTCPDLP